jgi:hypothetical protein
MTTNQPSHYELGQQLARLAAILEPIPARLDKMEEKFDNDIKKLQADLHELKEARSHFVGIGVGIGITFTFIAGLIAAFANGALKWVGLAH